MKALINAVLGLAVAALLAGCHVANGEISHQISQPLKLTPAKVANLIMLGKTDIIQSYLDNGGDSNLGADDLPMRIISVATFAGRKEIVKALLEKEAEMIFPIFDDDESFGELTENWPLLAALVYGRIEIVQILLDYGANPSDMQSIGTTPLMLIQSPSDGYTSEEFHEGVISASRMTSALLKEPRERAIANRHKMAKILLVNGADPNVKNEVGNTVLTLAEQNGDNEMIRILKAAGAK